MSDSFIVPIDALEVPLALVGGKGMNLARLAQAGFAVPPGCILTTAAYDAFVTAHALDGCILGLVGDLALDDRPAIDAASQTIRAWFAAHAIPAGLDDTLRDAYDDLGCPPVAVRSSATAKDLPGFSFAGQQDTYLNVIGHAALQKAVVDCWGSLWTARAISYRMRNGIDHDDVSLAVVVQRMVASETSGVLFTANPLTGKRTEAVIDATFGLGEALVSGRVEPDQYVVDAEGQIRTKTLGAKDVVVRGQAALLT